MEPKIRREKLIIAFGYDDEPKGARIDIVVDIPQPGSAPRTVPHGVSPVALTDLQGLIEGEAAQWIVAVGAAEFKVAEAQALQAVAESRAQQAEADRMQVMRTIDMTTSLLTQTSTELIEARARIEALEAQLAAVPVKAP